MPNNEAMIASLRGGYSQEELEAAFSLVRPILNWKLPISAVIPADADLELIEFAIGYFAGSPAIFSKRHDGQILVEAAGYYASVGA